MQANNFRLSEIDEHLRDLAERIFDKSIINGSDTNINEYLDDVKIFYSKFFDNDDNDAVLNSFSLMISFVRFVVERNEIDYENVCNFAKIFMAIMNN